MGLRDWIDATMWNQHGKAPSRMGPLLRFDKAHAPGLHAVAQAMFRKRWQVYRRYHNVE